MTTFDRDLHGIALGLVPNTYRSLLNFERLEDRSLLSASPLVVDLSPDTQADSILVALDASGTNLQVAVNGNVAQSVPLANVSQLSVVGSPYGNSLTVDSTNGAPIPSGGLAFKGAAAGLAAGDGNSLLLQGGSFDFEGYTPISQESGRITFGRSPTSYEVSFENVAVVQDTMSASVLSVIGTSGDDAITFGGGGPLGNLNLGQVEVNDFTPVSFANKTQLNILGVAGTDRIDLDAVNGAPTGLTQIEVVGGPISNTTLTVSGSGGADSISVQPIDARSAEVTGAEPVPINCQRIDQLRVNGRGGAVNLTITTPGQGNAITVTPGDTASSASVAIREFGGAALLPISYTNFALTGSLNFLHTGGGRTDDLYLSGSGVNDTFEVGTGGTDEVALLNSFTDAALPILAVGISDVTLDGSAGQARFDVGAYTSFQSLTLIGNGSTDPAVANFFDDGSPVTVNLGGTTQTATGGGLPTVNLGGVGVVNLYANGGAVTVAGAGNDNLAVTPTGTAAATVQDNSAGPLVNVAGANASGLIVSLPGTGNTLTVNGSAGNDTITATNSQVTVNNYLPIKYTAADLAALDVNGLDGTDSLVVDGTNGAVTTPTYYDGGNALDNNIVLQGGTASFDQYEPTIDAGQRAMTVVYPGGTEQVFSKNIAYVQDNVTSGGLSIQGYASASAIKYRSAGDPLIQVDNTPGIFFENKSIIDILAYGNATVDLDSSTTPAGLNHIYVQGAATNGAFSVAVNVFSPPGSNVNFAPTSSNNANISGSGPVPMTVTSVAGVNVDGGGGNTNLTITTPGQGNAITVTPGDTASSASVAIREFGGAALLPISYTNFAVAGLLNFVHTGGGRTDELYLSGSGLNDTFQVGLDGTDEVAFGALTGGSLTDAALRILAVGISDVTLDGSAGQARFDVGAYTSFQSLTLIGNGSTDPAGANLFDDGLPVAVDLGGTTQTATGGGLPTVNLGGVGVVNLYANGGAVTVAGTGNDILAVTPTGTAAATVLDNSAGPLVYVNGASASGLIVSLPGTGNTLTVNGSAGNDTITATNSQVTVNNDLPIKYTAADLAALDVNGLDGTDSLVVDGTNGAVTTPTYFDGGNALNNNIVLQGGTASLDQYEPTIDAGQRAMTVAYPNGTEQVFSKNIAYVQDNVTSGGLYVQDYASASTIKYRSAGNPLIQVDNAPGIFFENKSFIDLLAYGNATVELDSSSTPAGLNHIYVQGAATNGAFSVAVNVLSPPGSNVNFAPTSSNNADITGSGPVPMTLISVAGVNVDGGGGNTNLTITTPVGPANINAITVTPGDTAASASVSIREFNGTALVPISYINFAHTGSLNFVHTGGGRTDELYLSGGGVNDIFQAGTNGTDEVELDTLNGGSFVGATLGIHTAGISDVTLDGSAGQAIFHVGAPLPYHSLTLIGNGSADPAVANLTGNGTAMTVNLGGTTQTVTGGGLATVNLSGVGVVNLNANGGPVTAVAVGVGNNNLDVKPIGTDAATLQDNGAGPTLNLSGTAGLLVSLPAAGPDLSNVLTFDAPDADTDFMTAVEGQVRVSASSSSGISTDELPVSYNPADLAALWINGHAGTRNSLFVDSSAGAVTTPILYDGGTASGRRDLTIEDTTNVAAGETYVPGTGPGDGEISLDFSPAAGPVERVAFRNVTPRSVLDQVAGPLLVSATNMSADIGYQVGGGIALIEIASHESLRFENKTSLKIDVSSGNNTVHLDTTNPETGLTQIFVRCAVPSNTTVVLNGGANQNINIVPSDAQTATINGAGAVPINLIGVNQVTVDGDQSADNLTITTPVGPANINAITVTPGDTAASASVSIREFNGAALLPISYINFAHTGSLSLLHAGGGRTDELYLSGGGVNDIFQAGTNGTDEVELDTLSGGSFVGATLGIHTLAISDVTLDGSAGQAIFDVGAQLPYHSLTLIGNGSTDPAVANLTGDGTAITVNLGNTTQTATGGGLGTVMLNGVADVNLTGGAGDITLANASATDDLIVAPTGANTATASVGSGPVVNTNNTGKLIVDDAATKVIVQGTQRANQFTIDETGRTVALASAGVNLKSLTLNSDVADVSVAGGPADDSFEVIPSRSTTGNDVVGSAAFQLPSNLLVQVQGGGGANDALLVTGPDAATLAGGSYGSGLFAVIDRASSTQGAVRLFQQSGGAEPIQYPDISYSNVQRVQVNTPGAGGFAAQTLVLGPDPYDPNDSPATAAYLGSGATINAGNLAIFPNAYENGSPKVLGAEHDWFRVVAQSTGTLDFQVYFQQKVGFLPGNGELLIDVYDASGNPIFDFGSNVGTSDQRRRIPAVAGETYYLHVYGALNTTINGYNLSVINTPVPKPDGVDLLSAVAPNITNTSTPTITIRLDAANTPGDGLADLPAGGSSSGQPPDGQSILIPFWSGAATAPNAPSNNGSFRIAVYDETSPQSSTLLGYANAVSPGVFEFQPSAALADGQHTLVAKVEFDSPSALTAKDVGPGVSLPVLIESHAPAVSFGSAGVPNSGLDAGSDTGVPGQPATLSDLITSASAPTFYGTAAAGAIVKLYAHLDSNAVAGNRDVLIGQTVALSSAGTNPSAAVPWKVTSNVDLNNAALGFPLDGVRTILVTATDAAGNVSAPQSLTIFLDTQGPRVASVNVTGNPSFKLFADKSTLPAPTPLVGSLDVTFSDLPSRGQAAFAYPAVNGKLATTLGNYQLVGESTGNVTIASVTFADSSTPGAPGGSVATLHFAKPLPDDRYTLTVSDHITDNAGNALDGEFGGVFPSGDGSPGGSFVASFTVNSRPHLGTVNAGSEAIDLNGNLVFDPQNPDAKNRDTTFAFGFPTDQVFAGKFADSHGVVNGFDKFAAYGFAGGHSRWLFDLNGDGKFDPSTGDLSVAEPLSITGTPLAANFDGRPADGAQVGLFDGTTWWLDVLNHHTVDQADVQAGGKLSGNLRGQPIVGDFDGDGKVDLGTYNNGALYFDLSSKDPGGKLTGNWNTTLAVAPLLPNTVNLQNNRINVVASDMDQDGITDIGFFVTGGGETRSAPTWYWLISSDPTHTNRVTGTANTLNHPFDPAPLGTDLFAQFGSADALPIVGLFDPPPDGGNTASAPSVLSGTAAWINKQYIDVLGRQPGAGELNYWVGQVDNGEAPSTVAQAILESEEHLAAVIGQLYQQYLGRAADPAGTQYWSTVWKQNGGPEQVQAGIIGSPEYFKTAQSLYPNLSPDEAWVTALYQNILSRDVDPQGLAYWVNYIQTHSKQSVVLGFVTSDEYRLSAINDWFVGYLGRSVDSAGAEYWLHQLQDFVGQDAIQIGILSSDEYTRG